MAILHAVSQGTVLLCNYDTGFRPPEMVKRRPCIVVSPRLPYRDSLCTVVPLSATAPAHAVAYQVKLDLDLPQPWGHEPRWAKADMLATVCFDRLDMFRTGRDPHSGKRKYLQIKINREQLEAVQAGIRHALGMGR